MERGWGGGVGWGCNDWRGGGAEGGAGTGITNNKGDSKSHMETHYLINFLKDGL